MIESMTARWLLTAVFAAAAVATGSAIWAGIRRPAAGPASPASRAAASFCVVMCAALIAMTWLSESAAVAWVQVAGFGCAAVRFGLASGGTSGQRPALPALHHAMMAVAMIWMLVAAAGAIPMRSGATGNGAMTAMSAAPLPVPVLVVSGLAAAYCSAACIPWLARAISPGLRVADPAAAGQAAMSAGMAVMLIAMM